MSNNTNLKKFNVEIKSERTGKSVISFQTDNRENARDIAYDRIASFVGVNRAVAALNYFVEIS